MKISTFSSSRNRVQKFVTSKQSCFELCCHKPLCSKGKNANNRRSGRHTAKSAFFSQSPSICSRTAAKELEEVCKKQCHTPTNRKAVKFQQARKKPVSAADNSLVRRMKASRAAWHLKIHHERDFASPSSKLAPKSFQKRGEGIPLQFADMKPAR